MAKTVKITRGQLRRTIRETLEGDDAEGGYGPPVGAGMEKVTQRAQQELAWSIFEALGDDARVNSLLDNLKAQCVAVARKKGFKVPPYTELREGDFDMNATTSVLEELARVLAEEITQPFGR